jgi:hypothetical protein
LKGLMVLTGLAQTIHKAKFLVNDNSTTILTGMGVAGTVTTAYLTGRATFKAARLIQEEELKREIRKNTENADNSEGIKLSKVQKVKLVWHLYIYPVGACATTVACIIVANKIASKKIAALTVASGISERALQEYKAKVEEKFTQRQATNVRDEIAQDRVNKHPLSREVILAGTGEVLCFDMYSGRYFQSSVEEIKRAENKVNYNLNNFMHASLSEFYEEVGLPPTTFSDQVGWNANNRVEVVLSGVLSPDNRPCMAVDFASPPITDYSNLHD